MPDVSCTNICSGDLPHTSSVQMRSVGKHCCRVVSSGEIVKEARTRGTSRLGSQPRHKSLAEGGCMIILGM